MIDIDYDALRAYRKANFDIKVELSKHPEFEGEKQICITHNGFQWTCITLAPHEIGRLIHKLQE